MSDFGKRIAWQMRNSEAKHDAPAQQEFADVRQHVYLHLSSEKRKQFKEDMKALVEVANRLSERGIRIEAEWSHDMLDDEGNCMGAIVATQAPRRWLEQIELWEETEDLSTLLPLA